MKNKRLTVLDLDNTIIYSTFRPLLKSRLLFTYRQSMLVYERPYARELIHACHQKGDVMVFTAAPEDYATEIVRHLNIRPAALFSSMHCTWDPLLKELPGALCDHYDAITILDDNPDVWNLPDSEKFRLIVPEPFEGDHMDDHLGRIMQMI